MAKGPTTDMASVDGRKPLPKLDLGRGQVRQLQVHEPSSGQHAGAHATPVSRLLPSDGGANLPDRERTLDESSKDDRDTLHIGLVIPDISIFRAIKQSVHVIKPHDYTGEIIVHCLLAKKDKDDHSVFHAFALTELGLIDPKVAGLDYPEQVELGWSSSTAPINRGVLR